MFVTNNKRELVAAMVAETGFTKAQTIKALSAFVKVVAQILKKGNEVKLIGFLLISVAERKATNGRNPRTSKAIKIAAKKIVKIKAGKVFS